MPQKRRRVSKRNILFLNLLYLLNDNWKIFNLYLKQ